MSVHIGELDSSVELAPEVGTGARPRHARQEERGCPLQAVLELQRQVAIDLARTCAEGYVD